MRILAIETSCDETAIALLEIKGDKKSTAVFVLGNALHSQVKLHEQYGGVYPMMAKREHAKALTHLLQKVLKEANELRELRITNCELRMERRVKKILEREGNLADDLLKLLAKIKKPKIDRIAVTNGPGLEPALWVGINFAKALSLAWNIPIIPINHMEGHILSAFLEKNIQYSIFNIQKPKFPLLALLISGGHTELVLSKKIGSYKVIGQTRDDAVGESFDKVARMLGLPYPGGPEISHLAKTGKENKQIKLPRPMLHTKDFDFSFSGLKTAVLYLIKEIGVLTKQKKADIALEFENSVTEVLLHKTFGALKQHKAKSLILGGGVSANEKIRHSFTNLKKNEFPNTKLYLPEKSLTTDNAVMIGLAAYFKKTKRGSQAIRANGNLTF